MAGIEQSEGQRIPIIFHLVKDGDNFVVVCPKLEIAHGGESPDAAISCFYRRVRAEVKGILEGKGNLPGEPDKRRPLAELLAKVEDLSSVFKMTSDPIIKRGTLY